MPFLRDGEACLGKNKMHPEFECDYQKHHSLETLIFVCKPIHIFRERSNLEVFIYVMPIISQRLYGRAQRVEERHNLIK